MKVLFLDVDGVLNRLDSPSMFSLGKSKVRRFCNLVKELDLTVVLSSYWRLYGPCEEHLIKTLRYRGVKIHSNTEYFRSSNLSKDQRGREIQHWLDNNPVSQYVILDDTWDFLEEQRPRVVLCDGEIGLTDEDVEKIRLLFKNPLDNP